MPCTTFRRRRFRVSTAAVEQPRVGRPDRAEALRRSQHFYELVLEGVAPDIAAREAGVSAKRAIRLLGDMHDLNVWPRGGA
jgi:hypothetical protein